MRYWRTREEGGPATRAGASLRRRGNLGLALAAALAWGWGGVPGHGRPPPAPEPAPADLPSALQRVLPTYDNEPAQCLWSGQENGRAWTFYVARQGGRFAGAAFQATGKGYEGPIAILVGLDAQGNVHSLAILAQAETDGIGTKITHPAFADQFRDKPIEKTRWKLRRYGGDVDAVTGATVSSRAVVSALKAGLDVYRMHRVAIESAGASSGEK